MNSAREHSTGRIIRTGWTEAAGSPAARGPLTTALASGGDRPRRPRARRLAAVLTAIAVLTVATPWLLLRGEEPEEVVRGYLEAMISGDLETVRAHVLPVQGVAETALTAPLREVTPGRISGYSIDGVQVRGMIATVRVTLRNAREEHTTELRLHAVSDGPLRTPHWELEPVPLPLLTLGPRASTDTVLLNGHPIEIPPVHWTGRRTDRPSVALHVLPGVYTVQLPDVLPPLVPRQTEVYVPPVLVHWQTGLITVDYRHSAVAEHRARGVILEELSRCLGSGVARPLGCPFGADLPADTPGSWRVVQLPEIGFDAMVGETFDYRGEGLVAVFVPAQAPDVGGELPTPPARYRVSVDFGATLRQDGSEIVLQHWSFTTLRPWPR